MRASHRPGGGGGVKGMEPTETMPDVNPDRAAALAADAIADRPLSPAAEASLARAVERLPAAITKSDTEARIASK